MGCATSSEEGPKRQARPADSQPSAPLEVHWSLLRAHFGEGEDGSVSLGKRILEELLDLRPSLEYTLFRQVDKAAVAPRFVAMFDTVFDCAPTQERSLEISEALRQLGERHAGYGVEREDYHSAGLAIEAVLVKQLADSFTEGDRRNWREQFAVVAREIAAGHDTSVGRANRERFVKQQKVSRAKLVIETWEEVKRRDLTSVGTLFYETLWEMNSELPDTLFKGVDKSRQATRLMQMIDAVVIKADDPSELHTALMQLGIRHGAYGVVDRYYPIVSRTFVETLVKVLQERVTPDVEDAWREFLNHMSAVMLEGQHSEEGKRMFGRWKKAGPA